MRTTLNKNGFFKKKVHSRRGFTLVEAVASVMILAIVCVGVLNAVAFSREMVFSNNEREKASDKAQLVADEIISAAMGQNPGDSDALNDIKAKVNAIANDSTSSAANIQTDAIGKVKYVNTFSTPTGTDDIIQYTIVPVPEGTDIETDTDVKVSGIHQKATVHQCTVPGWDIQVRVYYKMSGSGSYRVVDVSAYAPRDYVEY